MACILEIKVIPQSGRVSFSAEPSGRIVAHLKSPPVGGKANQELVKTLAKLLGIPLVDLTIVSGVTSRIKRVKVAGSLTFEDAMSRLGFSVQTRCIP